MPKGAMKLRPDLAGTALEPYKARIRWRDTTNYAAAVLDDNPVYFDDTRSEGIIAHPCFPFSVTWPVISRLGEFVPSNTFPEEILMTQVHYTEHLKITRLIRPDDQLTLSGVLAAILPHRSGTHAVIKIDAADHAGQPVFTEYIGAMLRGVECGNEKIAVQLPQIPDNPADGAFIWQVDVYVTPLAPYIYDGCSNIEFPIHTSPGFAKSVGLPGIVLQGSAAMAYAVREIVNREADGNPRRVRAFSGKFTGMIMPGANIRICCTGRNQRKKQTDIFFDVINTENQKAIRSGHVTINR
mgnify:CR=1 FL=1